MDKQKQTEIVGQKIDSWLDEIDAEADVSGLSENKIQAINLIIDSFVQIAIVGLDKEPDQWDAKVLGDVMFSSFAIFLEKDEKTRELYSLIPFALKKLFKYLQKNEIVSNGQHLVDWVNVNSSQLQSLYDPNFDKFYRGLIEDMRRSGIDKNDKEAVDRFTKHYLDLHPELGIDLYKSDK